MKGVSKSTGHNWRFKDETGKRFGRLKVIQFHGHYKTEAQWECLCDCGKTAIVVGSKLRNGHTVSCGCFRVEKSRKRFTTHGATRTPEWRVWVWMRSRCYDPKCEGFPLYGGRGIKVCARWRNSFASFLSDMGKRPSAKHSIERKDNNGNYELGNCKWALPVEQANNKRNNRHITVNGVTKTFAQWERVSGLMEGTISNRLRRGWNSERATQP